MEPTFGSSCGNGLVYLLEQVNSRFPAPGGRNNFIILDAKGNIVVHIWVNITRDGVEIPEVHFLGIEKSDFESTTTELLDVFAKYLESVK